jgi:hypothetical protein
MVRVVARSVTGPRRDPLRSLGYQHKQDGTEFRSPHRSPASRSDGPKPHLRRGDAAASVGKGVVPDPAVLEDTGRHSGQRSSLRSPARSISRASLPKLGHAHHVAPERLVGQPNPSAPGLVADVELVVETDQVLLDGRLGDE